MVIILLTLFLAILPIYLIGNYYYKKDTVKEPKKLLQKLFFGGILSTIIVIIISIISFIVFPKYITTEGLNHFELLIYSFIFIALVEELAKWLVIYKIAYNHQDFDQYFDIILYSVFVGLGFACLENILYVFTSETAFTIAILRSITAVPGHACFQTYMGYYLGNSKFGDLKDSKKNKILSILIPIILHGLYDYLLLSANYILLIIYLIFIITMFILTIKKIKKIVLLDEKNLSICPNCHIKIESNFCPNCGYQKTKK